MTTKLVIIRGPAGSGKEDLVKVLKGRARKNWWDQSMFWYHIGNGHYHFDVNRIGEADKWIADQCIDAMSRQEPVVILTTDDPSSDIVDFYVQIAENHDYEVEILRTDRPWIPQQLRRSASRHVPLKVIQQQVKAYQEHPDEREASQASLF